MYSEDEETENEEVPQESGSEGSRPSNFSSGSGSSNDIQKLIEQADKDEKERQNKKPVVEDHLPKVGVETIKFLYFDNLSGYWLIGPELGSTAVAQARCARSNTQIPDGLGGLGSPWEVWDNRRKQFVFDSSITTHKCGT